jgi:TRAP-type C4-dicarboxylate transport system permease small subunit
MFKGFFCNDNGTPSGNRFFLFMILAALISWANLIVCKNAVIPEVPSSWIYIIGIFSGVVMATKVAAATVEIKTNDANTAAQP